MILGFDTDVLVGWAMAGAPGHAAARRLFEHEIRRGGAWVGLAPQVLWELIHVVTDARRFEAPMSMDQARELAGNLWDAREVQRIVPGTDVAQRTLTLLGQFGLGRKRILDTALAATLEAAGVRRLATFNRADFASFPFLEVVSPDDVSLPRRRSGKPRTDQG